MARLETFEVSQQIDGSRPILDDEVFVEGFTSRGLRDVAGRSLRELDLVNRLSRYPLG